MTLVETLVAIAIVLVFFSGAVLAFLQIVRTKEQTQARLDALANARHALEEMSLEIKRARLLPQDQTTGSLLREVFYGSTTTGAEGDRIDNDQDGRVDEEFFDGNDEDADWTVTDDRHASLSTTGTLRERSAYVGLPDLDDARVDEDCLFSSSTLFFETFPLPGSGSERRVTFSLGNDVDGEPNSLMMQTEEFDPLTSQTRVQVAAVAHDVVSFTALYYDATQRIAVPPRNPWRTDWSSTDPSRDRNSVPSVPPSVYLSVSVHSAPYPLSSLVPGQQIETVKLDTVVDVESVLADPRYDNNLRRSQ